MNEVSYAQNVKTPHKGRYNKTGKQEGNREMWKLQKSLKEKKA